MLSKPPTSTTVSGLTPGTSYTFTVRATNPGGLWNATTTGSSYTIPTAPTAPTGVTAVADGSDIDVSWTAPSSMGSLSILGYYVTPYIGGAAQTEEFSWGSGTSYSYSGLTKGQLYTFKVRAVTGWDPDPTAPHSGFDDPLLTALQAPLTSAMIDLYTKRLNWRVPNLRYELLNGAVNRSWGWNSGRSAPEALGQLRGVLALDGNMRVLVTHGYTDLVTPYFASKLLIDQLPAYGQPARITLAVYPGGHMFYSRPDSRAAFKRDAAALFAAALKAREATGGQGAR